MIKDILGGGLFMADDPEKCGCGCSCQCGTPPGSGYSAGYFQGTGDGAKENAQVRAAQSRVAYKKGALEEEKHSSTLGEGKK